jgi:hypothetical protein
MQMPMPMPAVMRMPFEPTFAFGADSDGARAQGPFDFIDPTRLRCLACCQPKAGFGACVARCVATGQACDGGVDNCSNC